MAKEKHDFSPGDKIKVKTAKEELTGIAIQSPDPEVIILKLDSGYNMGISRKDAKEIEILEKYKPGKEIAKEQKQAKGLPKISILHTGGTIASKVDYRTGAVVARFTPEELVRMIPELNSIANIDSRLISNMFSEDMRFAHYNMIAREIEKELKKGVEGIIITHGTDTMHYTSAALSFMIENSPVPIILVGAQRSSDRGSSDAFTNMMCAVNFAAKSDFSGVGICMHYKSGDDLCAILPGTKARKMHTSRRDAFQPINAEPIAIISTKTGKIDMKSKGYAKKDSARKAKITFINEDLKIGMIKMHPNIYASEILNYKGFDGIIMEGTGLGHAPINEIDSMTKENTKIKGAIRDLSSSGTLVVMAPQTIFGRIDMDVYSTGRDLQAIGVLGNLADITPETAFVKLAWLLSNFKKDEVKKLIAKNLRGEIAENISEDEFL